MLMLRLFLAACGLFAMMFVNAPAIAQEKGSKVEGDIFIPFAPEPGKLYRYRATGTDEQINQGRQSRAYTYDFTLRFEQEDSGWVGYYDVLNYEGDVTEGTTAFIAMFAQDDSGPIGYVFDEDLVPTGFKDPQRIRTLSGGAMENFIASLRSPTKEMLADQLANIGQADDNAIFMLALAHVVPFQNFVDYGISNEPEPYVTDLPTLFGPVVMQGETKVEYADESRASFVETAVIEQESFRALILALLDQMGSQGDEMRGMLERATFNIDDRLTYDYDAKSGIITAFSSSRDMNMDVLGNQAKRMMSTSIVLVE